MTSADPVVAVVDDELPVRTMLGRVLRLADYEVAAFASGEEFLASLPAQVPACAIFDVHMPGLSGMEVQARLRVAQIRIPVVMITASDDAALDRQAHESGAVCLLRKPFSSDELLAVVGKAIDDGKRWSLTKG